jgi:hypothetical protein
MSDMKKIRWLVVGLAALWGYYGRGKDGGVFTHRSKTPVVPPKFAGCEGDALYTNFSCMQTCRDQANNSAFRGYDEQTLGRSQSCHRCKNWDGGDTLLDTVLRLHDGFSSDSVLDASSGKTSLDWISRELRPKQWTAVTATEQLQSQLTSAGLKMRAGQKDRMVVGSWKNESFLQGEQFDLVLMDQLLPALERLWPHGQDQIFDRLAAHLAPGGRMYVTGQDPEAYPHRFKIPGKSGFQAYHAASLLHSVSSLQTACELHAHHRSDRPLPLDWVLSTVKRSPLLEVESAKAFPVVWGAKAFHTKLDACESMLKTIQGIHLINGLKDAIRSLRDRIDNHPQLALNGLCYGVDYLVIIKRKQ